MKDLEKRLKELQKRGYEQIDINEVLRLIHLIKQDAFIKRHKLDE